ncbi:hypothetical protein N665_3265s0001 [Sinapis alba]|nr:hypothetical protein N665_3265s0001 [Sinapis alba]
MNKHMSIHFKFKGRMYNVMLKMSMEDATLSIIEDIIYKKFALDESNIKLELSYTPMVVGCEEQLTIYDDEDIFFLFVEDKSRSEQLEQLLRGGNFLFGMNYIKLQGNDDEIGPNDIILYVEDVTNQQDEVTEVKNDNDTTHDDRVETDTAMDTNTAIGTNINVDTYTIAETVDKYVKQTLVIESSQFIKE